MTVRTQFTDFSDFTVATPIPESDGKEGLTIHYAEINPVVGNETIPMMWFVFEQNGMNLAEKNILFVTLKGIIRELKLKISNVIYVKKHTQHLQDLNIILKIFMKKLRLNYFDVNYVKSVLKYKSIWKLI